MEYKVIFDSDLIKNFCLKEFNKERKAKKFIMKMKKNYKKVNKLLSIDQNYIADSRSKFTIVAVQPPKAKKL